MYPVSVITPCYDERPDRVQATVVSAIRAGAAEVVVIDDGSHWDIAVPPSASIYRQEHAGIAAAINHGLRRTTCEHICWLSCGDVMPPHAIATHLAAAEPATFGDWLDGDVVHTVIDEWRDRIWYDNQFSLGVSMIDRSIIEQVGGFDESLQYSIDWAIALKIEAAVGWTHIPEVLMSGAEYADGHTDRAEGHSQRKRWQRKCLDNAMVSRWARRHELACKRAA